jgi:8-oxo-dGTP diphosphatase
VGAPAESVEAVVQRTVAYCAVSDDRGRTLVTRTPAETHWILPGATVAHGEHPLDAARRGLTALTGLTGGPGLARAAVSDVVRRPDLRLHTIRLIFDVELTGPPPPGLTFVPGDDGSPLPLAPFVAEVLGAPADPAAGEVDPPLEPGPPPSAPGRPVRVQRPGAYAVIVEQGRILLTRLAATDSLWSLPGGGIDFGEPPLVALRREMYEETGLDYTAGPLLAIGSRHFTGRSPDGRLEDFQGLRLIYGGAVPLDRPPRVTEVGGSTDQVAWVPLDDLPRMNVSRTVHEALTALPGRD